MLILASNGVRESIMRCKEYVTFMFVFGLAKDGDSIFVQNADICLQMHVTLQHRTTSNDIFAAVRTSNII
jgi:hypothetical protein